MNKYDALRKWVEAREHAGLDQMDVALFFGVSQPLVSFWENGKNTPTEKSRRERMIEFLLYDENEHGDTVNNEALKGLKLKQDSQTFHEIWDTVMVNTWKWRALTDEEKERFNLDPALGLYFNVPSRPLNIKRVVGRDRLITDLKKQLLSDKRMALTGKPGVGKTMLAIELARDSEMMEQCPDGIIWVRMGRQPTIMSELRKIAEALGINLQEDETIDEQVLSQLV